MQIIISIMIVGLLWMIYDLLNAPEVDEDENFIGPTSDEEETDDIEQPTEIVRKVKPKKEITNIED